MAQKFKRGDIVEDDKGNAFEVIGLARYSDKFYEVRSVVTKEIYEAPADEVTLVPGAKSRH